MRLQTPLLYANATPVGHRIKQLVAESDTVPSGVILDTSGTDRLDITSALMLERLTAELHSAGIDLALTEAHVPVVRMARRASLLERLGEDRLFHTIDQAVDALTASTATIPRGAGTE